MMLIKPNIAWFFTWFHPNLCSNFCQILLNLQTFHRKLWGRPQTWVCFEWAASIAALHCTVMNLKYTLDCTALKTKIEVPLHLKSLHAHLWHRRGLIQMESDWLDASKASGEAVILSDRDTADKSNVIFTLNKHQDLQSSSSSTLSTLPLSHFRRINEGSMN